MSGEKTTNELIRVALPARLVTVRRFLEALDADQLDPETMVLIRTSRGGQQLVIEEPIEHGGPSLPDGVVQVAFDVPEYLDENEVVREVERMVQKVIAALVAERFERSEDAQHRDAQRAVDVVHVGHGGYVEPGGGIVANAETVPGETLVVPRMDGMTMEEWQERLDEAARRDVARMEDRVSPNRPRDEGGFAGAPREPLIGRHAPEGD